MGKQKDLLVKLLDPITDANPDLLSNYVCVLLKNSLPRDELEALCRKDLQDFLGQDTDRFIKSVFEAVDKGEICLETLEISDEEELRENENTGANSEQRGSINGSNVVSELRRDDAAGQAHRKGGDLVVSSGTKDTSNNGGSKEEFIFVSSEIAGTPGTKVEPVEATEKDSKPFVKELNMEEGEYRSDSTENDDEDRNYKHRRRGYKDADKSSAMNAEEKPRYPSDGIRGNYSQRMDRQGFRGRGYRGKDFRNYGNQEPFPDQFRNFDPHFRPPVPPRFFHDGSGFPPGPWGPLGPMHMPLGMIHPPPMRGIRPMAPAGGRSFFNPNACPDFEEKGYCLKGDMCPLDHGMDRIILEDPQSLEDLSLPVASTETDMLDKPDSGAAGDLYDPEKPLWSEEQARSRQKKEVLPDGDGSSSVWKRLGPRQDLPFEGFPGFNPGFGHPELFPRGQKRDRDFMAGDAGNFPGRNRPFDADSRGPAVRQEGHKAKKTVYVGNIPADVVDVEEKLFWHFKKFGRIMDVRVTASKDKAFVQFDRTEEAEKALTAPEAFLGNRFINLHWAKHDNFLDSTTNKWFNTKKEEVPTAGTPAKPAGTKVAGESQTPSPVPKGGRAVPGTGALPARSPGFSGPRPIGGPIMRGGPRPQARFKLDNRSTVLKVVPPIPAALQQADGLQSHFVQFAEVASVEPVSEKEQGSFLVRFKSRHGAEAAMVYGKVLASGERLSLSWGPAAAAQKAEGPKPRPQEAVEGSNPKGQAQELAVANSSS